jgi:hypothetical protein
MQFVTNALGETRRLHVSRQGFVCAACRQLQPKGAPYVSERTAWGRRLKIAADCWLDGHPPDFSVMLLDTPESHDGGYDRA